MPVRSSFALILFAVGLLAQAQTAKTITVRVFDGRSGQHIQPDNVIVRINRRADSHVEWVHMSDDGVATLTLPADTLSFSVRATYASSTEYYINCDVSRQRDVAQGTWFPVADVLTQGLVMPNECESSKSAAKLKLEPKPGEFFLLVRKRTWHDTANDMR